MTGTYVGDTEGQHGVCVKCAGTGWKGGAERFQKLRDDELQRSLKNDAIMRDQVHLDAQKKVFEGDKKRAAQALEMLNGLALREKALSEDLTQLAHQRQKFWDEQEIAKKDNARALAALEEEREEVKRFRDELSFVRDEVERYREEFRRPIKKLVKEVEALRETVEKLATK